MMSKQAFEDNKISQSNFEQMMQKRIHDIEQKVSKYCSQYDSLMNLLPIGNNFSQLFSFEKDIQTMDLKIDSFDKKINSMNEEQLPIDKSFWEQKLESFKSSDQQCKKQIQNIKQALKENTYQQFVDQFESKLQQRVNHYEQIVTTKLANYKNKMEKSRHKESKQNYKSVMLTINKKIEQLLNPYNTKLDLLLEEIQITKLKVPQRNVKDFFDFNHQRLMQQILQANQKLQKYFQKLNHPKKRQSFINLNQIYKIENTIDFIRCQSIGNKQKCLNDLLIVQTNQKYFLKDMQIHINQSFQELNQNLLEIKERLNLLKKYIANQL